MYDKVYLIKPIISNITTGERYIVCKTFNVDLMHKIHLNKQVDDLICPTLHLPQQINSIIENKIPYYFLNKIEESNANIGQQQITAYIQIINIFKNKNRNDKIEILKRNHIQQCIHWCEKNQIPHNKFINKINMFLIDPSLCISDF